MTKNQQILFNLLTDKGYKVKTVYYYPNYGYLPNCGWVANLIVNEDGFSYDQEYHLGNDFIEAKGQIINNEIKIIDL